MRERPCGLKGAGLRNYQKYLKDIAFKKNRWKG